MCVCVYINITSSIHQHTYIHILIVGPRQPIAHVWERFPPAPPPDPSACSPCCSFDALPPAALGCQRPPGS